MAFISDCSGCWPLDEKAHLPHPMTQWQIEGNNQVDKKVGLYLSSASRQTPSVSTSCQVTDLLLSCQKGQTRLNSIEIWSNKLADWLQMIQWSLAVQRLSGDVAHWAQPDSPIRWQLQMSAVTSCVYVQLIGCRVKSRPFPVRPPVPKSVCWL